MKPCYNYLFIDSVVYRIDINNATVRSFNTSGPKFSCDDLHVDQPTIAEAIDYLNKINEENNKSSVNFISFTSQNYNSGYVSICDKKYRYLSYWDFTNVLRRSIPPKLRAKVNVCLTTLLRDFVKVSKTYRTITYGGTTMYTFQDRMFAATKRNLLATFPKICERLNHSECSFVELARIINTTIASKQLSLNSGIVTSDGDIIIGDSFYKLRKSVYGKYYLSGPMHELFGASNHKSITDAIKKNLPEGMKRIGIFPEFDDLEMLYEFVQKIGGLTLKRDVCTKVQLERHRLCLY